MEAPQSSNLDLLRSIAVLLVLAQHLLRRMQVAHVAWIPVTCLGLFGVLLFFVHTSFVLMLSLQRSGLTGLPLLRNFYVRRIFRIYPLSVLAVFTALALHLDSDINGVTGLSHGSFPGMRVAVSNLLLVQNLVFSKSVVNVLWSLPFELQMYIFLPFLFLWISRGRRLGQLLSLWALSVIAAISQPHLPSLESLSILRFLPNFLPGAIAFALPQTSRVRAFLWPVLIAAMIGTYTLRPTESTGWILCLILGMSIPLFAQISTPWICWISNRIATYSYGIYLSHQFSIWIAFGLLGRHSPWLRGFAFLGLLLAVPTLLYHGIEKPLIGAGVRLARRWSAAKEPDPKSVRLAVSTQQQLVNVAD